VGQTERERERERERKWTDLKNGEFIEHLPEGVLVMFWNIVKIVTVVIINTFQMS
jgi:hypothetical protein